VTHYTPGVTMSRGVLPWAAPELLRSPARVTHKADVYSFGIVLWELWALRSPYSGMRHQDLVSALVNSSEIVRPEIPGQGTTPRSDEPVAGWKDVMRECWAENPEDRPEFESIESKLLEMAKEVKKAQRQPRADRPEAVAEETIA
jgi:serine/threonine protein kinase